MSVEIDPREVLKCLNELGYYGIDSKQLKEFTKDLKTLIKYDQKKAVSKNEENIQPKITPTYYPEHKKYNKNNNNEYDVDDYEKQENINKNDSYITEVFDYLYSASTVSSRAKSVPGKQNIISVQIVKPKVSKSQSQVSKEENIKKPVNSTKRKVPLRPASEPALASRRKNMLSSNSVDSLPKTNELRPKTSFIRVRKPLKISKSDPVSLYNQYQEEWKKQKLPGENKHLDLRWAIRERMLGDHSTDLYESTDKLSRKTSRY